MCGIAGLIHMDNTSPDPKALASMTDHLIHRGPDASGHVVRGPVALGHRRLSIIDVEGGTQPMMTGDDSIAVTFNGEIYNFQDLRRDLERQGHHFRTQSDTEVLLALWQSKGVEMVHDLWGMFAFTIHDHSTNQVFLAVDRFGQKPLYYRQDGNRFAFASEPAALKALQNTTWTTDPISLHHYLTFLTVPAPRTIWKEVHRLSGGHSILIDLNKSTINEQLWYHHPGGGQFKGNRQEARAQLIDLLRDATRRRMISDVPLGAFLSGGVDSAITVALMKELSSNPVKTFTISLNESKWDESLDAQRAANHLQTDHHVKQVQPCDPELFLKCVNHLGEPFADSSYLPTALVSAHAREHVTVALSGDAADEAFGGYDRYRAMIIAGALDRFGRPLRNVLLSTVNTLMPSGREDRTLRRRINRLTAMARSDGLSRYFQTVTQFSEDDKAVLYTDSMMELVALANSINIFEPDHARSRATDTIDQIMNLDLNRYLQDDILVKVDRASMMHSLEVRSPFLDHRVQEFASSLPRHWKVNSRSGKIILKEAFADRLPPGHFNAPKRGFALPLGRWFRGPMKDMCTELLTNNQSTLWNHFDKAAIANLFQEHLDGRNDHGQKLWCLCVFSSWSQSFNSKTR